MFETPRPSSRERLIRAAADMFYSDGIHPSGVDAIVERAGVSKPTLYKQFGSKEKLLAAVLERRHENRQATFEAALARGGAEPRARLLAVFDWLEKWLGSADFQGCALVNAAVELSGAQPHLHEIASRNKRWTRERLAETAREAGCADPERLARGLMLVIEGAVLTAFIENDPDAARSAREAAQTLLATHLPDAERPPAESAT
jgi:AcrR family transcriptional regulator